MTRPTYDFFFLCFFLFCSASNYSCCTLIWRVFFSQEVVSVLYGLQLSTFPENHPRNQTCMNYGPTDHMQTVRIFLRIPWYILSSYEVVHQNTPSTAVLSPLSHFTTYWATIHTVLSLVFSPASLLWTPHISGAVSLLGWMLNIKGAIISQRGVLLQNAISS